MKKEKLEIFYSVTIIISIPLLLAVNTIYLIRTTRSAYNSELRTKADVVNAVLAESFRAEIEGDSFTKISSQLNAIQKQQTDITQAMLVQRQNGNYFIVSRANDAPTTLSPGTEMQTKIVYERKVPVSKLINTTVNRQATQGWNVATPVFDANNNVMAVSFSTIAITRAQAIINKAFTQSFVIMLISIVVIVVLLFRHFRLVGYIQLLARQREINQTMSDFLSVATHELKAPTSIIKGYIANVMDDTTSPISDGIREQLQVALLQTERLNNLVKDLLNVSRVEQGRVQYNIESVDSTNIIDVIVQTFTPIANEKGLTVSFTKPAQPLFVKADAGRVQEIFTNLIDNAIKYTPEGSVFITQSINGPTIITSIRDTGLGMSTENRKRLFQRFYRIQNEQTKNISGTGLGLWIIKQYIEAMGGKINVASKEGEGTEFTVTLPMM